MLRGTRTTQCNWRFRETCQSSTIPKYWDAIHQVNALAETEPVERTHQTRVNLELQCKHPFRFKLRLSGIRSRTELYRVTGNSESGLTMMSLIPDLVSP